MADQEEKSSDTMSRYAQNIGRALRPAPAVVITTTDAFHRAALAARNMKFTTVIIDEQTVMTHEDQLIQPQRPKF